MDEYISKKQTIDRIASCYCMDCEHSNGVLCRACEHQDDMDLIDDMPVVDVQPVKRGYWIKQPEKFQIHEDVINSNYLYSCSCCNASDLHSERANNDGEVKFCWRCGAKMDAEPDEPWQSK